MRRPMLLRTAFRQDDGIPYPLVTPEGTELTFTLARAGDRLGAFLLDTLFQVLLIVGITIPACLTASGTGDDADGWVMAFVLVAIVLVQNLYFIFFEARTSGCTPGKRIVGTRVMDAKGGPLRIDAVVVRNLMRVLEFYLPLATLLAPEQLWPGTPRWISLLAIAWMIVLAAMPLFNRRRLRIGDMVAGTVVATAPKPGLLPDLGGRTVKREQQGTTAYAFTPAQLDAYGIYELQVLEDVLRQAGQRPDARAAARAVADQIAKKIGWSAPVPAGETKRFLDEFYASLRRHLEQKLLFGKRKKDKYSRDA